MSEAENCPLTNKPFCKCGIPKDVVCPYVKYDEMYDELIKYTFQFMRKFVEKEVRRND